MPIVVTGALELRKALKKYAPDLAKESQKEVANALKPIVRDARGFLPTNNDVPSGWLKENQKGKWENRGYDQAIASKGITYQTTPTRANRSGFKALAAVFNKSAAGAIYETAGRKSGNVGRFTPRLSGQLKGDKPKMTGRAMFRAWAEDQGKTNAAVIKAIQNTNEKVADLVKSGGGRIYKVKG
jgi:hypothetical protein